MTFTLCHCNLTPLLYLAFNDWMSIAQAAGAVATVITLIFVAIQQKRSQHAQFENSLFQLINLHNDIISKLTYEKDQGYNRPPIAGAGREVFNLATDRLKEFWKDDRWEQNSSGDWQQVECTYIGNKEIAHQYLKERYRSAYYDSFEPYLNHYFRNLYHIFKYIDESDLVNKKQKKKYSSIVRAQLSQKELYVIMFNAMVEKLGYPGMTSYIKKYELLDNFRSSEVAPAVFWDLYKQLESKLH